MRDDIGMSEEVPYQHIVIHWNPRLTAKPPQQNRRRASQPENQAPSAPVAAAQWPHLNRAFSGRSSHSRKAIKSGQKLFRIEICADTDLVSQNWNIVQFTNSYWHSVILGVSCDLTSIQNLESALDARE